MIAARTRTFAALATVLVGVGGLTACSSTPSNKRVVEDVIESLEGVSQSAKDCMQAHVDRYSNDDLTKIAKANEDFSITADGQLRNADEALRQFEADLQACVDGEPGTTPTGSEPTGSQPESSAPSSTESTASTVASESTATTLEPAGPLPPPVTTAG